MTTTEITNKTNHGAINSELKPIGRHHDFPTVQSVPTDVERTFLKDSLTPKIIGVINSVNSITTNLRLWRYYWRPDPSETYSVRTVTKDNQDPSQGRVLSIDLVSVGFGLIPCNRKDLNLLVFWDPRHETVSNGTINPCTEQDLSTPEAISKTWNDHNTSAKPPTNRKRNRTVSSHSDVMSTFSLLRDTNLNTKVLTDTKHVPDLIGNILHRRVHTPNPDLEVQRVSTVTQIKRKKVRLLPGGT